MTRIGRKVIITGIIALALALTGCGGSTTTTATSATPTRGSVTGTQTAAAVASPNPVKAWCHGIGGADLRAVEQDDRQVQVDSGDGNVSAVQSDGAQLMTDANAAEGHPPPMPQAVKLDYILGMGTMAFAGTDMSDGDWTAAETAIKGGDKYETTLGLIDGLCGISPP